MFALGLSSGSLIALSYAIVAFWQLLVDIGGRLISRSSISFVVVLRLPVIFLQANLCADSSFSVFVLLSQVCQAALAYSIINRPVAMYGLL